MNILAIDQGTTGTTTVLYNKRGEIVYKAYREFTQIYPHPGWVEHNPTEIWQTVVETVAEIMSNPKLQSTQQTQIAALGITNQRETTLVWNRLTGEPLYNAIVWQCRRTSALCKEYEPYTSIIQQKTGLPLDAYFSATKLRWILDNIVKNRQDDLCFGTIDSWLLWKLTSGQVHATDMTNASRTLLFNIDTKQWDTELCNLFQIQHNILPEVKKSIDDFGVVSSIKSLENIPIYSVAGDQQAALFGQLCLNKGQAKNTYGTGAFMVMNTGQERIKSNHGLITTVAIDELGNPCYALEGTIFIAGAAIQWLRDELNILLKSSDSEQMATALPDNGGVYFVPAFVGLAAPYWDMEARGALVGLTRGTNRFHLARAALEAMAYQSLDVLEAMESDSKIVINELVVDGGAVANNFLMQFQANLLNRPVLRPKVIESTSLGVALMAGLKAGLWQSANELKALKQIAQIFMPKLSEAQRNSLYLGWQKAVRQTRAL